MISHLREKERERERERERGILNYLIIIANKLIKENNKHVNNKLGVIL